jgi:aryl-alcohol dehydrogenase-like predicted oxidoreductase
MNVMRTAQLGTDGPEISAVGFGSWAAGGPSGEYNWGPQDDGDSIAAIRRAVEGGVTWIDTAAVYGLGHAEDVVGRALAPYRVGEDVLVFTKCGLNWYGDPDRRDHTNLRPTDVRFEIDQSLRRLGVERIDLYQFHWPDEETGTPVEDSWNTMAELVNEGKVRYAGVSNFDVSLLERCEAIRHVDSLQPPYSLLHPEAAADVIPWCRAHGTGVIVYSPMGSGLLTGAFSRDRLAALPVGDWRKTDPDFQEPSFTRALQLAAGLRRIADRLGVPTPALTAGWTLHTPGVTGAICGARRPEQADGWLPAGHLQLDTATLNEIEDLLTSCSPDGASGSRYGA